MHRFAKTLLETAVSVWARAARFSFPKKYSWRWKLAMLAGRYERETTKLFKRIVKRDDAVVDIGAHIGYFTRLAARKVGPRGNVYAFEPDTENRTLLEQNTERYPNVFVHAAAITEKDGRVSFYHVAGSTGCHSTIPQEDAAQFTVPATTLDSFVATSGISLDVIKIDIEGGEWAALRGMKNVLKQPHLSIIIEWKPSALEHGGHPEDLLKELADNGFTLSVIGGTGLVSLTLSELSHAREYLDETGSVNIFATK